MKIDPRTVFADPRYFLALGFGSGLSPRAPGTAGSLVALACFLVLNQLHPAFYAVIVVAVFGLGVWVSDWVAKDLHLEDPGVIVIDEFVGLWISLFLVPSGWYWVAVGFLLFRFFDIVKPWPVNWLDRNVKGGFGIMADDVAAGLYAFLCIQALALMWSAW
jgi:phosphatidylglycerophosphatase A